MTQQPVRNPEEITAQFDQLSTALGRLRNGALKQAERQSNISEADQTEDLDRLTIDFSTVAEHIAGVYGALGPVLAPADTGLGWPLRERRKAFLDAARARSSGGVESWPSIRTTVADPRITLRERRKGFLFEDATLDEMRESKGPGAVELLEVMEDEEAKDEAEIAAVERQAIVEIGRWLKRLRDEQDLTQGELAKAAGTTPAQLSLLENGIGRRGPSIGLFARLLHGLGFELVFET